MEVSAGSYDFIYGIFDSVNVCICICISEISCRSGDGSIFWILLCSCLLYTSLDQTYVKAEDCKQSVAKYLESVSKDLKITKMIRFEVGEGMEKKQEDFAAEVAAQMNA